MTVGQTPPEKESVRVLRECIQLQLDKAKDYQNPNSNVVQADHYRRGIDTIFDTMNGKMLRIQSLLETVQNDPNAVPKHESIEDSFKDLINYASFGVSWLRKKMEGQDPDRDMFNRKIPVKITAESDYFWADGTPKYAPPKMVIAETPGTKGIAPRDKTDDYDWKPRPNAVGVREFGG